MKKRIVFLVVAVLMIALGLYVPLYLKVTVAKRFEISGIEKFSVSRDMHNASRCKNFSFGIFAYFPAENRMITIEHMDSWNPKREDFLFSFKSSKKTINLYGSEETGFAMAEVSHGKLANAWFVPEFPIDRAQESYEQCRS